jgi:shikimate 5-dehydrogenase
MSIQTVLSGSYDLIVNTTPSQAKLDPDFLNFGIQDQALYYDVNYFDSHFLDGKLRKQDGLSMLIYQALETWEIWFGKLSNKNEIHHELYKILRPK